MTLSMDERKAVVACRLQKAQNTMKEAKEISELGYWHTAANRLYGNLFELRHSGDYDDWKILEEEDIKPYITPAENLIIKIESIINQ